MSIARGSDALMGCFCLAASLTATGGLISYPRRRLALFSRFSRCDSIILVLLVGNIGGCRRMPPVADKRLCLADGGVLSTISIWYHGDWLCYFTQYQPSFGLA